MDNGKMTALVLLDYRIISMAVYAILHHILQHWLFVSDLALN